MPSDHKIPLSQVNPGFVMMAIFISPQASEVNKENVERLSNVPDKRPKVSTPTPVEPPPPKPTILSPILPTRSVSPPPSDREPPRDEVWSQKVRRSYSRLSGDASFSSPREQGSGSPLGSRRETLFGFEKMPTPKVMRSMSLSVSAPQASSSLCGVTLNLTEIEDSLNHSQEPDPNIPGVAIAKKQAKKKRVQPIKVSYLLVGLLVFTRVSLQQFLREHSYTLCAIHFKSSQCSVSVINLTQQWYCPPSGILICSVTFGIL